MSREDTHPLRDVILSCGICVTGQDITASRENRISVCAAHLPRGDMRVMREDTRRARGLRSMRTGLRDAEKVD